MTRKRYNTLLAESLTFEQSITPNVIGDDGYMEDFIVKEVLRNFMTYGYCEFYSGSQLNTIIGPNGSGKSNYCIGCAGQVVIGRDGVFETWGIEIQIKFRYFVITILSDLCYSQSMNVLCMNGKSKKPSNLLHIICNIKLSKIAN
ncbi:hypothetical protein BCR42DRAFT_395532 [Absidia repens]|uniref:Structural maintenance of chromosomes protein 5 n=1 Tax=Absidia repens TaxID=90262 RepID=A0A1X2I7E3_9FUNG|nr:hypothetical protein BCR42DRAFT_395532 [Absidia repens]